MAKKKKNQEFFFVPKILEHNRADVCIECIFSILIVFQNGLFTNTNILRAARQNPTKRIISLDSFIAIFNSNDDDDDDNDQLGIYLA